MILLSPSIFNVGRSMLKLPLSLLILASDLSTAQELPPAPQLPFDFQAKLSLEHLPSGEKLLNWTGQAGFTYFIQASSDLQDWTWAPNIEPGIDGRMSYEIEGPTSAGFFRLIRTDQTAEDLDAADFDDDGLSNNFELTPRPRPGNNIGLSNLRPNIQTSPLRGDTDGDGLSDKWEIEHNLDPTDNGDRDINNGPDGDPDADGVDNRGEHQGNNNPRNDKDFPLQTLQTYKFSSGSGYVNPSSYEVELSGMVSQAIWTLPSEPLTSRESFSLQKMLQALDGLPFPELPGSDLTYFFPFNGHRNAISYAHYYLSPDGVNASGYVTQHRLWIRAPAETTPQRFKYIKSSFKATYDVSGALLSNEKAAEVVTAEIAANQKVSAPIDLKPILGLSQPGTRTQETIALNPLRLVSRDRYLAGSINLASLGNDIAAEFINTTTGESLGTYRELERYDSSTKIFDSVTQVLDPSLSPEERQPASQKVWFVRDNNGDLNFYACFAEIGEISIQLKSGDTNLVTLHHTLTSAQEFSAVIDYVNDWVKGTAFTFAQGNGQTVLGAPPANGGGPIANGAPPPAPPAIDYLATACLMPFFNVISQVEGLSAVAIGLFDGVKAGLNDDWEFCKLIGYGLALTGDFAWQQAQAELDEWRTSPIKRATELHLMASRFVQEVVFNKLKATRQKLSTWEGFKDAAWKVWERHQQPNQLEFAVSKALWTSIVDGLTEWLDDFASRMEHGAEKAHWSSALWTKNKLLAAVDDNVGHVSRTASYALGYSSGYIIEQVAVGALTMEAGNLAKVAIKGGVKLGGNLPLRTAFSLAARGQLLKRWAAEEAVTVEAKVAAERGLGNAVREPISAEIKEIPAEVIEKSMRAPSYNRDLCGHLHLGKEVGSSPRLQLLFALEGNTARSWNATATLCREMGNVLTPKALKNWPKLLNSLAPAGESAIAGDLLREADLFAALKLNTPKGKQVLNELLESLDGKTATEVLEKTWLPASTGELYPKLYRYSNWKPTEVNGVMKLDAHPSYGWYATPEKLETPGNVVGRFQLPLGNAPPKYRLEFDYASVDGKVRFARAEQDEKNWLEIVTKDYLGHAEYGQPGGGQQFLIDDSEVPLSAIYNLETGLKEWPIP